MIKVLNIMLLVLVQNTSASRWNCDICLQQGNLGRRCTFCGRKRDGSLTNDPKEEVPFGWGNQVAGKFSKPIYNDYLYHQDRWQCQLCLEEGNHPLASRCKECRGPKGSTWDNTRVCGAAACKTPNLKSSKVCHHCKAPLTQSEAGENPLLDNSGPDPKRNANEMQISDLIPIEDDEKVLPGDAARNGAVQNHAADPQSAKWQCRACTFVNPGSSKICDMCYADPNGFGAADILTQRTIDAAAAAPLRQEASQPLRPAEGSAAAAAANSRVSAASVHPVIAGDAARNGAVPNHEISQRVNPPEGSASGASTEVFEPSQSQQPKFQAGDRVEINYQDEGWVPATIKKRGYKGRTDPNGCELFAVVYDDTPEYICGAGQNLMRPLLASSSRT